MSRLNSDQPFKLTPNRPRVIPGPEHNPWYWNPRRMSVRFAPDWFLKQLHQLGGELSCTWDPIKERWLVWMESPRFSHKLCQGWKLLFINQEPDGRFLPLDERVFARLYAASVMAHGDAKTYFNRIQAEMERDKTRRDEQSRQETIDMSMPFFEHSKIKNIGKGNKFSTYHA